MALLLGQGRHFFMRDFFQMMGDREESKYKIAYIFNNPLFSLVSIEIVKLITI